ncbi:hypothetical protein BDR03DRAFT_964401 [Suillus americanus]|nr:hypothetical protein BDR03DRAFT_964401 [Suillus americanus]
MGNDGVRYRLGPRRANSGPSPLPSSLPQASGSQNGLHHERASSESEITPYSKLRPHIGRSQESPSPGAPPISGTSFWSTLSNSYQDQKSFCGYSIAGCI